MDIPADIAKSEELLHLGTALAIGLLFGLERGWRSIHDEEKDLHVAGLRTYGLIGLLGGAGGLLAKTLQPPVYGLVFLGIAAVMATAYAVNYRGAQDAGITSLVAALLAFALGTLSALGHTVTAASAAVLAALLLGFKPQLHRWVSHLEAREFRATLKLLLITVVLLPILPNQGYGPGEALNPYEIWWMVVLIASISYVGYFAVRIAGSNKGIILTSLFAGLASSTALTLHLARLARQQEADRNLLSAGILIANGTLFPRILVIVAVIQPKLAAQLAMPMAAMALLVYLPSIVLWMRRRSEGNGEAIKLENPLELGTALRFGAFLAAVMLAGSMLASSFGNRGFIWLAAISGMADLNAITLSAARMSQGSIGMTGALVAIVVATAVNNLVKTTASAYVGGAGIGLRVGLPMVAASAAGLGVAWLNTMYPDIMNFIGDIVVSDTQPTNQNADQ